MLQSSTLRMMQASCPSDRGERLQCWFVLLLLVLASGLVLPVNSFAQQAPDGSPVRPVYERGDARLRLVSTTGVLGATQGAIIVTGIMAPLGTFDELDEYVASVFGGTLLGGAAGTIVPLIATQNTSVRRDAATLTAFGGVQGYAHASELILLIGGADGVPPRPGAFMVAGLGAAEATAGYLVGQRWNAYAGTSEMLTATATAGHLVGYGASRGIGADWVNAATDEDERLYAGSALAGSLLGMWAGYRLGQTGTYTTGDARLYALSGLIGGGLGLSSSQISQGETARRNAAVAASGAAIGLGAGALIGRTYDFTPSEGNIIVSAGVLTGSVLGAIGEAASEAGTEGGNPAANLLMISLGTAIGAGATIALIGSDARARTKRGQNAGEASSAVRLDVNISPYSASGPMPMSAPRPEVRPVLNLTLSF